MTTIWVIVTVGAFVIYQVSLYSCVDVSAKYMLFHSGLTPAPSEDISVTHDQ